MSNSAVVSVIIPCRNEEKFIGKCLDSIIKQNYPKENLEVLVVDGMSQDKTRKIIIEFRKQYSFIKLLDNPKKITPTGLNIGIKNSKGKIVMKMDAHTLYTKDYISKSVRYLDNADNVGGKLITLPAENTIAAKAIALSLSCSFGAGNSYFRTGSEKQRWVDTVFGGCYRKEVFEKIGFFNENLARSQDMELNLRLKKAKGRILLAPDIVAYYYPKSNFKDFLIHNFNDGVWAIYPFKFVKMPLRLRHYIPLIFVLSLIMTGLLGIISLIFFYLFLAISVIYLLTSFYFSLKITMKEKDVRYLFLMPIAFANRHIGYGLGSLWGMLKLWK
ncbi:glycosyltransferase family 2 protein [Candidatus Parcubacteria bacterium]|nr:glycosyltransferase family 2 protein [Candidatus Parcubacteria bacterium]